MNNPHFVVLFHQVNYPLAAQMTRHLVQAGFTFALVCEDELKPGESLASRLKQDTRPLLLMVSDNFLKDASCVSDLLPALHQGDAAEVQIIIRTEGFPDDTKDPVPTRLDRVGQILHYINYWQDRYLQLRKTRPDQIQDVQAYEALVKQVRKIAFEIGNLIEFLREQQTYSWEALTANHYELFFRKSGNISLHADFKTEHPFLEEDELLENRIRESMAVLRHEQDNQTVDSESLVELPVTRDEGEQEHVESPRTSGNPEHELLQKLIAYKNGLELTDDDEIDVEEDDHDHQNDDDDDWDEDEEDLTGQSDTPDSTESKGGHIISMPIRNLEQLKRLVQHDPENIPARLDLAALLAEDDQYFNETTNHLEEVLRLDPKNARAFTLLGQLSEQYKENKLSIRYYEKALESDPTYGQAHLGLGRILLLDPDQLDRALDHLSDAKSLLQENTEVLALYANALVEAGKVKKAAKTYKKLLKLEPANETWKAKLADLYYQIGDRIKAVQVHRQPVERELDHPDTGWPEEFLDKDWSEDTEIHTIEKVVSSKLPEEPIQPAKKTLTVLITGATSGIGRATAKVLAKAGHRLIITGRREERLHTLHEQLKEEYQADVFPLSFDIRQEAVTRQMMKALPESWANVDVLINNAGLASGLAPIHEGDIADWDRMIDTNIKGLLYMTRAISPGMVKRQRGQIINICSTAGKEAYPNGNVYCATKFAVDALTRSMRLDLHPHGIRVGQVSPGHVEETEFAITRFHGDAQKADIYSDFNPLTSQDVAHAILFMIQQPPHVNVQDILMMGTQQGSSTMINRTGRVYDQD
ncbi:MAG: SDR family NAD(P)-dependent oxidoreductase [Saprospiraceae bacterium]|nr:SDR family NAD(P)-dependent oxidoreductase [Saprospiraceae bacterium]